MAVGGVGQHFTGNPNAATQCSGESVSGANGRFGVGEEELYGARRPGRPRTYASRIADQDVEAAMHKLLKASLDQRSPSRALVRTVNIVLDLVGHPLSLREGRE